MIEKERGRQKERWEDDVFACQLLNICGTLAITTNHLAV
jgi:hypothetical protein